MNSKISMLLAFFLLGLSFPLIAQGLETPVEIKQSKIFKDKKKNSELLFAESDGSDGMVIVRSYRAGLARNVKGYMIEYYDGRLKLVKEAEIEANNSAIKNILVRDGKLHVIEYRLNRSERTHDYYVLTADLNALKFSENHLFSIDYKDIRKDFAIGVSFFVHSNLDKIDHDPTGEVQVSANGNFVAFNFDIKDNKNDTHRIVVYDHTFEQVMDKTFSEDFRDKYFRYNDFTVSDIDGSVYFLGKAYLNDTFKDIRKGEVNYVYKLYKVSPDGIASTDFDAGESYVSTLTILVNQEGLFCIGTYSDRRNRNYNGIAYFKMNPESLQIDVSVLNPFSKQFMIDKYGENKGSRKADKGKGVGAVSYRDFFLDEGGNIYFNAEEYFITTRVQTVNGVTTTTFVYHYNDIYTCKINPSGKLEWMRTVNKRQATTSGGTHLSFSSALNDGKMYIFLNGSKNIKKMRGDRIAFKAAKTKKMNLYMVEIQPDGSFDYRILIDDKDSKLTYKTMQGVTSDGGNVLLLEGDRGKDKQLLKLTL